MGKELGHGLGTVTGEVPTIGVTGEVSSRRVAGGTVGAAGGAGKMSGRGNDVVVLPVGMWGKVGFFMMGCLLVSSVMMGLVAKVMWWGQESVWARALGWVAVVCWLLVVVNVVWLSSQRWRERKEGEGV